MVKSNKSIAWILVFIIAITMPFSAMAKDLSQNDPRIEIINNVSELNPASPQSDDLDEYLDDLMSRIIDEDMDTYEQLKACYDYVKDNTRYGSHVAGLDARIGDVTCRQIYRAYGEIEGFGAVALVTHVGMCNAYASAFILMARKIGFDADLVKGQTKGSGGGYVYHEWCEIDIDGTSYIFDPQLDQSLTRAGLAEYTVFCATHSQVPGRYIKY